jgi:hypothetical protein
VEIHRNHSRLVPLDRRSSSAGRGNLEARGEFRATRLRPDPAKSFSAALLAPGREREIPQAADAYGWLIGSWELDVFRYHPNGTITTGVGEAHFGWLLEGRAAQDVWIMPNRSAKTVDVDRTFRRYGTTVHIWNPLIQAWDVTWIDPVTNIRDRMTARSNGADVVQVGTHSDRTPIRWSFTEITPDAFRWLGEAWISMERHGSSKRSFALDGCAREKSRRFFEG